MTTSPIWGHASSEPTIPKSGMRGCVADVVTGNKFYREGILICVGLKMEVSHWLGASPLQQVSTAVLPVIMMMSWFVSNCCQPTSYVRSLQLTDDRLFHLTRSRACYCSCSCISVIDQDPWSVLGMATWWLAHDSVWWRLRLLLWHNLLRWNRVPTFTYHAIHVQVRCCNWSSPQCSTFNLPPRFVLSQSI